MRIVVCVRKGLDGELGPFDAAAYEEALRIQGAEVILLTMGPQADEEPLLRLTRLGAARAVLLSDKAFAGADTLATAYTLSLAIKRLNPDLVFCGRQTLIGDTGQTGIMLATLADLSPITGVMQIREISENAVECLTRSEGEVKEKLPALLCFERTNALRLPRLRSKLGSLEIWNAKALDADLRRCGLIGSPTRVLKSFENQSGKRKCTYISREELSDAIQKGLQRVENTAKAMQKSEEKLPEIYMVGEAPRAFAESVSDTVHVIPLTDAEQIASEIQKKNPAAVLWGCDAKSKRICATVAARLGLGLCADCTALGCEDGELMMYRPALSGSVIAKIQSLSRPAMATVRTESRFTSNLEGDDGGIGLMQLTPEEFAMIQTDILRVPPEDKGLLYDPQKNLQCGTAYLSYLYQRYGVWETVFAAFDAGTASVDAWLANPEYVTELGTLKNIPDKQTARFVRDVMKARELYIKLYF